MSSSLCASKAPDRLLLARFGTPARIDPEPELPYAAHRWLLEAIAYVRTQRRQYARKGEVPPAGAVETIGGAELEASVRTLLDIVERP